MRSPAPLPDSRLYTFIDTDLRFALYFLEGQRLIRDVALLHPIRGAGFAYFRDVVLSIQPTIALLKHGEQYGFYIDSDRPRFLLKIETGHHGATRCVLLPEGFAEFPEAMHGHVRLQKLSPHRAPYESVLLADGLPLGTLVNRLLLDSFQTKSVVLLADASDQSILLHRMPPLAGDEDHDGSATALAAREASLRPDVETLFARALSERETIVAAFAGLGFRHLADRRVALLCSCSKERFVQGLSLLGQDDREDLFAQDSAGIEVTCEYCKTRYAISREDLARSRHPLH
jgi:molecular chaperone Hsp33